MNRLTTAFVSLCWLAIAAEAASPSIGTPQPRGGQRGTEVVVVLNGRNLDDAQEVFFYNPGFVVTKWEVVNPTQVKATIKIAPDCRLGEHAIRVRTATGISEMRTFWVGALPITDEKEPNSDFATPQKIGLNTTVHGVINNEDVDYYAIEAKKGERISVEIEAMRLANAIFDPYIAILDSRRFELASSDDSTLLKQDGCFSILAPADGTYIVQVRDSAYQGNGSCQYRLHVGTFPRPLGVVPAGGKPGEEVELRFIGDSSGDIRQKVKLPDQLPESGKFEVFCQDAKGISPSGIPFRLTVASNVVETEPNDSPQQGTLGTLPCAFNGVIEKPGDRDCFRFVGKQGQAFEVHCFARRIGSPLDPIMLLGPVGGAPIVSDDDSGGPDSIFRVTLPKDGEYYIQVYDHLRKGGPNHFYRVELIPIEAKVNLAVPSFQQFTQERQAYAVPQGNRFATLISAGRVDVGGDLNIAAEHLPAKVTIAKDIVHASTNLVPIVFEAAPDAPLVSAPIRFVCTHSDPKVALKSSFEQRAEFVYGNPGNYAYSHRTENRAVLAVTKAVPFKISIVEPKVPLVHNGSMQLKIVAERQADFKAPITIFPLYNPPGVASAGSVVIPEGKNEIVLPLNANGGAPVRKWKYAVLGTATVGNGPVWVSSQLATLEIAPPYLGLAIERGAVEQGKETQMFVKFTPTKPFNGNAKVRLMNLPAKVTTKERHVTKDTKEIAFPIKVEATAPAGIHRNIFCQVTIEENGEPIVHNLGSSELRIDVPLPPKKDQPVVAKPPTPMPMPNPMGQPPKRLSRLEQLRLEQQEREKAMREGKK